MNREYQIARDMRDQYDIIREFNDQEWKHAFDNSAQDIYQHDLLIESQHEE